MNGPSHLAAACSHAAAASATSALRAATCDAHAALEAALPLLDPHVTKRQLIAYLQAILPVVAALEQWVGLAAAADAQAPVPLDWSARRRLPMLVADLRALGAPVRRHRPPWLEQALGSLSAGGRASGLGVLYVLEGSTLGASKLCRHLALALGPEPVCGLSYLRGHGAQTGARWRETRQYLNGSLTDAFDQQLACHAATLTFFCFWRAIAPTFGNGRAHDSL